MRVVAGRWRGRRLLPPAGDAIRPTADRVKEALFSILGGRVTGALFVDLCCGSGALGIEALSRGAVRAVFIDEAPASLALAEANLAKCGADPVSWSLERSDALTWLDRWQAPAGTPWVLVADPPYRAPLAGPIMERLRSRTGAAGCRALVVEQGTGGSDTPAADSLWTLRKYGQATLALWLSPQD